MAQVLESVRTELEWTRELAAAKIANAPVPSAEAVRKARLELETAKRAGGEARGGSAADRRRQRYNLFVEFGGLVRGYVLCHGCGTALHHTENGQGLPLLERGKIFTKRQGGGYQLPNLLPECFGCNRGRGATPVRKENLE